MKDDRMIGLRYSRCGGGGWGASPEQIYRNIHSPQSIATVVINDSYFYGNI